MNLLIVGDGEFEAWLSHFRLERWASLRFASDLYEIECHTWAGSFQSVIVDLDMSAVELKKAMRLISGMNGQQVIVGVYSGLGEKNLTPFLDHGGHLFFHKTIRRRRIFASCAAVVSLSFGVFGPTIDIGKLQLDINLNEFRVDGKTVQMTRLEYQFLKCLVLARGRVLTAQSFFDQVYFRDDPPQEQLIKVLVSRIRSKLAHSGAPPEVIRTVRGVGYALATPSLDHGKKTA